MNIIDIMDISHFKDIDVPLTTTLAMVALVGYVFGTLVQRRKVASTIELVVRLQRDLSRAKMAAYELGKVVCAINNSTATHYSRLKKFQKHIARLGTQQGDAVWHELCQEVDSLLGPTLQLANEIANAQERIRYQSNYLMTFSEAQTDPLTGLGNRRAFDHVLSTHHGILKRYGTAFSLAVVDIDHFKELNDQCGHQHGDRMLCDLAELLKDTLRTVDIAVRYGGEEFVVVMPQTDITGAATFSERLRLEVERKMPFTVSIGVASANDADTPESLFQRADAAMYRAKGGGRNRMCCDFGEANDAVLQEVCLEGGKLERNTYNGEK